MLFRKWRWCAEVREFKRADDSGEFGVVVDEGDDAHFSSTVGALQGVQFIELFEAPCPERGGFLRFFSCVLLFRLGNPFFPLPPRPAITHKYVCRKFLVLN